MLLAAWLWLASPPVLTEAPETISWTAPPECPSETEFAARVAELTVDAQLTASFEFVVEGHGPLELRVRGQSSRYVAARCDALVDTALLLVSLALVSTPAEVPTPAARAPDELGVADRRGEASDVAPFLRANRRTTGFGPSIGISTAARLRSEVGASSGITPTAALELFIGAGPRGEVWAVDLGLLTRPAFGGASPQPNVGARLSTWGALVRVCAGPKPRRMSVAACAGVELGVITARAHGDVIDAQVGRRPWLALEIGPDFAVPIARRVALVTHVGGTWLALRPSFRVADAGLVCCRDALGLSARIGVEIGLGR